MMNNIFNVDLENVKNAIPSFITIIAMPLTYSITKGIGLGIISFVVLDLIIYIILFIPLG